MKLLVEVAGSTSSIVSSVERQRGRQDNDHRSQLMMKLVLRRGSDCSAAALLTAHCK